MRRLLVLLLVICLVPFVSAQATSEVSSRALTIASWDGTVLAADLYWPEDAQEALPAILMTHGWAGTKADLVEAARWLASAGYVVLAYDSRGFGASEGVVGLNGPDEWADVSALVSWLALLQEDAGPRVLLDDAAEDDPRIGMYGFSYGGAIQLLAAAHDDRIDALVPDITWSDLVDSLYPDTVVKRGWVDLLFWGGILSSYGVREGDPNTGGMDERLQQWYLEAQQTGRLSAEAVAALAERSPSRYLDAVEADVLLTQGWRDTLFDPDEAIRTFDVLAAREDAETHLLFHPAGHGHRLVDPPRLHFRDEVLAFYAWHLADEDARDVPIVQWYDAAARTWRTGEAWPPAHVLGRPVQASDARPVRLVQAPAATTHTETQEFEGALGPSGQDLGLATTVTLPLDLAGPVSILGAVDLHLNVTSGVNDLTLFFALVDLGPRGDAVVIANQVTPQRLEGQAGRVVTVEVPLVSVAHTLANGHALGLRVATSDSGYLGGREAGTVTLDVGSLGLVVPVFDREAAEATETETRGEDDAKETPATSLLLLALLVALIGVTRSRFTRNG